MKPALLSLGTATPPRSITQARAAELASTYCLLTREQARLLPTLYRRACVTQRGSVVLEDGPNPDIEQTFFLPARDDRDHGPTTQERMDRYSREAPLLAIAAARQALDEARVVPEQITQIVTVTCTGFEAPGVDYAIIHGLGLRPTVGRTQVGFMGCHGAMNGFRVAGALAASGASDAVNGSPTTGGETVLLCAVELCTLHFYYGWDPQKIVANAIFADGAAAAIIAPAPDAGSATFLPSVPQSLSPSVPSSSPTHIWRLAASGSCIFPDSRDTMTWRIGNHGFVMTLSPRVPELIEAHLPAWIHAWLGSHHLRVSDIASWAIHPGGPRITKSVAACLGLPDHLVSLSDQVLAQCGNMSSPTLMFILDRLRRSGAKTPCVAIGFGPGLAAEAALFV